MTVEITMRKNNKGFTLIELNCAYPKPGTYPVYKEVIDAIRKGDTSVYGGTADSDL